MYRLDPTQMTHKDNSERHNCSLSQGSVCVYESMLLLWLGKQWLVVNVCRLVS
jgi:hypothetical protein